MSAILKDIESKKIQPKLIEWPATLAKIYYELFLDPSASNPRPRLSINMDYAMSLSEIRLTDPIILVHVEDRGLIAYEEQDDEPHHVVVDGNHRIAVAAKKRKELWAYVLSRNQSERYETFID